jgi:hypothetical protein
MPPRQFLRAVVDRRVAQGAQCLLKVMDISNPEIEELLRRVVRDDVRAAIADIIPADVGEFLTYKQAAEELNAWWRPPWDTRKRLTARDIREYVEMGGLHAVRFASGSPRIALTELRWLDEWHRHTCDEKDREYREQQKAEREYMQVLRRKERESRKATARARRSTRAGSGAKGSGMPVP